MDGCLPQDRYPTQAGDHRAEIIKHVIEPCYLAKAKDSGLDKQMGREEILATMKRMTTKTIGKMIDQLSSIVAGEDLETRMVFYRVGAKSCANSK